MSRELRVENLTVSREGTTIVSSVDLFLRPGELVGVVGPNGGGKTSLLLALRGLLPSEGELTLDGLDPRTASRGDVARRVAVVPQSNELAFSFSVEELVLLGRSPYRKPWQGWSSEDRETAGRWLDRLKLSSLADRSVDSLSGGERRRVFIARALAQETPFLFLDEPFAGLDPAAIEQTAEILEELVAEGTRGVLVVLHDLSWAERLCTRVLGLGCGRQLFCGAPTEVLSESSLEELFGVGWQPGQTEGGERFWQTKRSGS